MSENSNMADFTRRALSRCGYVSPATARARADFLKRHNLDIKRYPHAPAPMFYVGPDDCVGLLSPAQIPDIRRLWPDAVICRFTYPESEVNHE